MTGTGYMECEQSDEIITNDPEYLSILAVAESTAKTNATILIQGESGTGKELLCRFIHRKSMRSGHYIPV